MATRRKKGKPRRDVPRVRRVRRRPRPVRAQIADDTHAGWDARQPYDKAERPLRVEYIGLKIERAWHDRGGVAHAAFLIGDAWHTVCDSREFYDEVRRLGSSRLRISSDQVNCMWCIQGRRQ